MDEWMSGNLKEFYECETKKKEPLNGECCKARNGLMKIWILNLKYKNLNFKRPLNF